MAFVLMSYGERGCTFLWAKAFSLLTQGDDHFIDSNFGKGGGPEGVTKTRDSTGIMQKYIR